MENKRGLRILNLFIVITLFTLFITSTVSSINTTYSKCVSDIQDGQKFTFYLYPNATWHDGQPVTSEDVKFSFETVWPQSTNAPQELSNIYRIDTPDLHTVEIYVNQAGYFEWTSLTDRISIVPKHIWLSHGPDFQNWNPSTAAELVGSGPFKWNSYTYDVNISLLRHPDWHFAVPRTLPIIDQPIKTRPQGVYIDELVFKIYTDIAQAMLALQNGDIDAYDDRVLISDIPSLSANPDISVNISLSSRYRVLIANCQRFPTNITGYRRAMAYGMDKYKINTDAIGGYGAPLDSYVSTIATEWEVESTLTEHFYSKDIVSANASLDASGFKDLDGDGWREYDANDNGIWDAGVDKDDMDCKIELWPSLNYNPSIIACNVTRDGLLEMGMRAEVQQKDWSWLLNAVEMGNHWVVCWSENIPVVNPSRIMYDYFRSGTPNNIVYYRFSNATVDAALDTMAAQTTLEGVKTESREVANLLAHEQPMIVCYNDANIDAYRTDKFKGFFLHEGLGITNGDNPYVATKVRLNDDSFGGTFKYCLSTNLATTNVIKAVSGYDRTVLQYIYESLWNINPSTWDPIPGLAYDWKIEQTTAEQPTSEPPSSKPPTTPTTTPTTDNGLTPGFELIATMSVILGATIVYIKRRRK